LEQYDIVIIGGGLPGAAAATLLRRVAPEQRLLLIEARGAFAPATLPTSEVSGLFLTQRLRLWDHLARHELPSHGPRFWFHNDDVLRIQDASELGTRLLPPTPSFVLREDLLCEHLLQRAQRAGAEIARPARVTGVSLRPWKGRVRFQVQDRDEQEIEATWVLDASGRRTVVGRALKLVRPNLEHPIGAVVGRWIGDVDIDGPTFAGASRFGRGSFGARRLGVNHFQGYGYRIAVRPIVSRGDDEQRGLSIAILYDKRVHNLHEEPSLGDAYTAFLSGLPAVRQLLQRATLPRQELTVIPHLAYDLAQVAGPGWMLLGSAAGYLDPVGAPSTDLATHAVEFAADAVRRKAANEPVEQRLDRFDRDFRASWRRRFEARHKDHFLFAGDFDLYWPSFLVDRSLYMLSEVSPIAWRTGDHPTPLPLVGPAGALRAGLLRALTRRMVRLGRRRMWTGHYGRTNAGSRVHHRADLGLGSLLTLVHGLAGWALREFENLGLQWSLLTAQWRGARGLPEGAELSTLPEGVTSLGDEPS